MGYTKSKEEIKLIKKGGKLIGEILDTVAAMAAPGVLMKDLDKKAEELIREVGGIPAFKNYKIPNHTPFPSTICASVNEEVVHGIPSEERVLQDGDIFSIDIGMQWPANSGEGKGGNGFFTDTALTVAVGTVPEKTTQLLSVTKKALALAIEQCQVGNTIADIGKAVEEYVAPQGYGIVKDLVGHGVGHDVHEEPHVPNYYSKEMEQWELKEGVVLALEPMITIGSAAVETAEDGWSVVTSDSSLSAHFEHTIIITSGGPVIATKRPSEK